MLMAVNIACTICVHNSMHTNVIHLLRFKDGMFPTGFCAEYLLPNDGSWYFGSWLDLQEAWPTRESRSL